MSSVSSRRGYARNRTPNRVRTVIHILEPHSMAKVLVVDDIAVNRELIGTLLAYQGHEVIEAADGADGLTLARAQRPALVISDILMPTMDGFEFVRQLRADVADRKSTRLNSSH